MSIKNFKDEIILYALNYSKTKNIKHKKYKHKTIKYDTNMALF